MSKKVIFLTIFIIAILIAIPLVYFLYFHESTSTDSGSEIKTTLNLKAENIIIDATRDIEAKTATLRIRSASEEYLEPNFQNSLIYKDFVVLSCSIFQKYYYNPEFRKSAEEEVASLGLNKTEIEKQTDEFLEGYSLESVNIEAFNQDESRLYTCAITGENEEDNLIGLFGSDGSRYSFRLDSAY
jgi:hypothetical protein